MSNRMVTAFIAAAALLLFVANLSIWFWLNVVDSDGFTGIAYEATTEEDVRHAIASIVVNDIMQDMPMARALFGDQVISSLADTLADEPFRFTFERMVSTVHRILVSGSSQPVAIDMSNISRVVNMLMLPLRLGNAEAPPRQMPSEIVLVEARDFPKIERVVDVTPVLAVISVAGTLAFGATGIYMAANRRRSLVMAGLATVGVAALTIAISLPVRSMLVNNLIIQERRTIVGSIYEALLLSLRTQSIILAAIGMVMIVLSLAASRQRT